MPADGAVPSQETAFQIITKREAAYAAEMDSDAKATADAIVHQVAMSLMDSAHLAISTRGHHLVADLTDEGKRYLHSTIETMVHGRMASHRAAGELAALRDRMAWGIAQ